MLFSSISAVSQAIIAEEPHKVTLPGGQGTGCLISSDCDKVIHGNRRGKSCCLPFHHKIHVAYIRSAACMNHSKENNMPLHQHDDTLTSYRVSNDKVMPDRHVDGPTPFDAANDHFRALRSRAYVPSKNIASSSSRRPLLLTLSSRYRTKLCDALNAEDVASPEWRTHWHEYVRPTTNAREGTATDLEAPGSLIPTTHCLTTLKHRESKDISISIMDQESRSIRHASSIAAASSSTIPSTTL